MPTRPEGEVEWRQRVILVCRHGREVHRELLVAVCVLVPCSVSLKDGHIVTSLPRRLPLQLRLTVLGRLASSLPRWIRVTLQKEMEMERWRERERERKRE
jgi:hypothetical protein